MKPIIFITFFILVSKPNKSIFGKDSDPLDSLVKNHVPAVCLQMDYQMRLDDSQFVAKRCHTPVKVAVCETNKSNLSEAASEVIEKHDLSLEISKHMSEKLNVPLEEVIKYPNELLIPAVEAAFIADFDSCLKAKKEKLEQDTAEDLEGDPEFEIPDDFDKQLTSAIAKQVFWTIASYGAKGAMYKIAKNNGVEINFKRLVGYAICQSASAFVASLKPQHVESFGEASCKEAAQWRSFSGAFSRLQSKPCMQTISDSCSAMGGFVDLNDWGIETQSQAVSTLLDISGFGLTTLCYAGGRTTAVACGTINVAVKNIIEFAKTGNNSLSECIAGPIARCLGHRIGAKGWLDDSPVAQPYFNKRGVQLRKCCACEVVHYKKTFFGKRQLDSYWIREVVQEGSGPSCSHRNPKKFYEPALGVDDIVKGSDGYRYENCRKITVLGNSCKL